MRSNPVQKAHDILSDTLSKGDIVIDGTMGNGHDTLFLTQTVGAAGHVYAFDIQENAIENTRKRLQDSGLEDIATLIQNSHAKLNEFVPETHHRKIKVAMFNFGYLPGSDKSIITLPDSSISALEQSYQLLTKNGLITAILYKGHSGGLEESEQIKQWLKDSNIHFESFSSESESATGPELIIIRKH